MGELRAVKGEFSAGATGSVLRAARCCARATVKARLTEKVFWKQRMTRATQQVVANNNKKKN